MLRRQGPHPEGRRFRAAYLNETAIERRGIAPLKPIFDSIERVSDKASLTRLLGRGLAADVDPLNWGIYRSSRLLGLSVEPSLHGEKTYVAFLLQGGLGLPDREPYAHRARMALRRSTRGTSAGSWRWRASIGPSSGRLR